MDDQTIGARSGCTRGRLRARGRACVDSLKRESGNSRITPKVLARPHGGQSVVMSLIVNGGLVLLSVWAVLSVLFLLSYRSSVLAEGARAKSPSPDL